MNHKHKPPPPADIEDICAICLPLPDQPSSLEVTIFPMKAVKKKAREEDTDVYIVELKPEDRNEESSWLVVKRPEKGKKTSSGSHPVLDLTSAV